jgi:A/G-specific adenine glycosylase
LKTRPPEKSDGIPNIGPLLLPWYRSARRRLPWRESPTPYSVWVSEVMLQQTRVEAVVPHYLRFLERFPAIADLAAADLDEVLALWSGLGYYRRARALHAGARAILEEHGGAFPRDIEGALALPGVGRYTAGAVLSIAYNLPVPVVDGNVERVLTRVLRMPGDPRAARNARRLREAAASAIPEGSASEFNQALMELGATVCRPASPECPVCPLGEICEGRRHGDAERYPESRRKERPVPVTLRAALVELGGRWLVERETERSYLRGLWVFPFVEAGGGGRREGTIHAADALRERLAARPGITLDGGSRLEGAVRHSITYRRITVEAFAFEVRKPAAARRAVARSADFRWARLEELGRSIPAPSLAVKIARWIEGGS